MLNKKIITLKKVAKILNESNITWALGASCLLYFKGITEDFNDIDVMVLEEDAQKAKDVLKEIGILISNEDNKNYKTCHFYEFIIDEIEFDIIAGFTINKENKDYYLPLNPSKIEKIIVDKIDIYLDNLEDWLYYYKLMDRKLKIDMINNYFIKQKKSLS